MQKKYDTVTNQRGSVVPDVAVTVYIHDGTIAPTVKATIYSDNGSSVRSNPIITGALGYFEFYAADGHYDIKIVGPGLTDRWVYDILLEDPADSPSPTSAALAASGGAGLAGFSHAETYVAGTLGAKLKDLVNVKDAPYNCKVDGATDDTAGYQAALNAAKAVFIPPGTLRHGNIVVPTTGGRTVFSYSSNAASLKLLDGLNVNGHTITNANDIEFRSITLDGNKANNLTAGNGLLVTGTSTRTRLWDVYIKDWREAAGAATAGTSAFEFLFGRMSGNGTDGFQCTTVDRPAVLFSIIETSGRYGAVFGSGCTNVRDVGNIYKSNAQGGSIMVGGNDAIRLGNIADTNGTGHGLQYNGVLRGLYVGNISKSNGISGLDFTLGSQYGAAVGNISYANVVRGMEIDSASYYVAGVGNVIYRNGEVGISVYRAPTTILVGNHALENGTTTAPKYGIRLWDDLNTLPSNNCLLIGNNATDDRGGSATQTYGVGIEAASTNGTILDANNLNTNVTGPVSTVAGAIKRARDNLGFITQNEGNATIANLTTLIVINHGLSVTPTPENFVIVGTNTPTNSAGPLSVTGITATQATINCRSDPGASGLNLRWHVSAY